MTSLADAVNNRYSVDAPVISARGSLRLPAVERERIARVNTAIGSLTSNPSIATKRLRKRHVTRFNGSQSEWGLDYFLKFDKSKPLLPFPQANLQKLKELSDKETTAHTNKPMYVCGGLFLLSRARPVLEYYLGDALNGYRGLLVFGDVSLSVISSAGFVLANRWQSRAISRALNEKNNYINTTLTKLWDELSNDLIKRHAIAQQDRSGSTQTNESPEEEEETHEDLRQQVNDVLVPLVPRLMESMKALSISKESIDSIMEPLQYAIGIVIPPANAWQFYTNPKLPIYIQFANHEFNDASLHRRLLSGGHPSPTSPPSLPGSIAETGHDNKAQVSVTLVTS